MLTIDQIRKYSLFVGLNEAELTRLAPCLTKRTYAKGVYLFYPGTPGLNTYLVEAGLVRLFFTNTVGQEFLINLVRPGEVFGLPLLRDDQFRLMGAAAYLPSVILSLACDDLLRLAASSPQLMMNLYGETCASARKLLLHTRSLVTVSLDGRLATMLLRLSRKDENQAIVNMPLTQAELAGWLGASRGRLNRAMKQLQERGLIRLEGQKITILDRPSLERMTEEEHVGQV